MSLVTAVFKVAVLNVSLQIVVVAVVVAALVEGVEIGVEYY